METKQQPGEAATPAPEDATPAAPALGDPGIDDPELDDLVDDVAGDPDSAEESEGESSRDVGLTAIVITAVLFLRIMAVAGWKWETAAELADSFDFSDAVPIFFGTLLELPIVTGIAAAIILPLAGYRLFLISRTAPVSRRILDWLIIALTVVLLFVLWHSYAMWWPAALAAATSLAVFLFVRFVHHGAVLNDLKAISRRVGTLVLILLLVLAVFVRTPWNPREEIGINGEVVHGHVVETSPGFLKILTDDRELIIVLSGDVEYRKSSPIEEPRH